MEFSLNEQTAPVAEPVLLADAKLHCRIDSSNTVDDDYIGALIRAARLQTEIARGMTLLTTTWDYKTSEFPGENFIALPRPPLVSITHLKYQAADGASHTWAGANYIAQTSTAPGRLVLADGVTWPSDAALYPSLPIEIQFVAGHGAAGTSVPEYILIAMKRLVVEMYDNREPLVSGEPITRTPYTTNLLKLNKTWVFR